MVDGLVMQEMNTALYLACKESIMPNHLKEFKHGIVKIAKVLKPFSIFVKFALKYASIATRIRLLLMRIKMKVYASK